MTKIKITDIKATNNDGHIIVTALLNDTPATINFQEENIADLSDDNKKAFVRSRLLASRPDLHETFDLGFDKL